MFLLIVVISTNVRLEIVWKQDFYILSNESDRKDDILPWQKNVEQKGMKTMETKKDDYAALTLDFWDDEVIYGGKSYKAGSIACDVLTFPAEVISQISSCSGNLNRFLETLNAGRGDAKLLPMAKQSALKILKMIISHEPFSYMDLEKWRQQIDTCFTPDSLKAANAYIAAQLSGKLTDKLEKKYENGASLIKLTQLLAHLGYSLEQFQKTMIPFAMKIHEADERKATSYAEIFDNNFPAEITFEDTGGWMSMTNATIQHRTITHPQKNYSVLVKRMHYVSFVGLFRSDLFEGLRCGHGPRLCPVCNRWFLTTNGYKTKYCGRKYPGHPYGWTCTIIGSREQEKEKAADNRIVAIYNRRVDSISKAVRRGSISREQADLELRLADAKKSKAFENTAYALSNYEKEMTAESIHAEAKALLSQN